MRNALIINGHQKYDLLAEGKLTQAYIDFADAFLKKNGFDVKYTVIESGYDIEEEVKKIGWAYYIFLQYPIFWAGLPWKTKKYIDEVFSAGQGKSTFENDGRSKTNIDGRYGNGGLMKGKRYMLSMTYNCPISEFEEPSGFYGELSVDEANTPVHKVFQFCGAAPMKTYSAHDIYSGELDMIKEKTKFVKILEENFL